MFTISATSPKLIPFPCPLFTLPLLNISLSVSTSLASTLFVIILPVAVTFPPLIAVICPVTAEPFGLSEIPPIFLIVPSGSIVGII